MLSKRDIAESPKKSKQFECLIKSNKEEKAAQISLCIERKARFYRVFLEYFRNTDQSVYIKLLAKARK